MTADLGAVLTLAAQHPALRRARLHHRRLRLQRRRVQLTERGWAALATSAMLACLVLGSLPFIVYWATT